MAAKTRDLSRIERQKLKEDALARCCRAAAERCVVEEERKLRPVFGELHVEGVFKQGFSFYGRPSIKPSRVTEPPARSADEMLAMAEREYREAGLLE